MSDRSRRNRIRATRIWEYLSKKSGGGAHVTTFGALGEGLEMSEGKLGRAVSYLVSAEKIRLTRVGDGVYSISITGSVDEAASLQAVAV